MLPLKQRNKAIYDFRYVYGSGHGSVMRGAAGGAVLDDVIDVLHEVGQDTSNYVEYPVYASKSGAAAAHVGAMASLLKKAHDIDV